MLYEGMMGEIEADDINAKEFYNALRSLIITIPEKYAEYKSVLHAYPSSRTSSFSPQQFDDMLLWTAACSSNDNPENADVVTSRFVSEKYANIASEMSSDFLETGIWGPDFKQRRTSPSSKTWGMDHAHADRSCPKTSMYTIPSHEVHSVLTAFINTLRHSQSYFSSSRKDAVCI